jgi:deoxyribodipyrimidine photo-lyase
MSRKALIWFRNDLRVRDNAILNIVSQQQTYLSSPAKYNEIICLYCFDPRYYSPTRYSKHKTGIYRSKFIIESVINLQKNLQSLNHHLLIGLEEPEVIIPKLINHGDKFDVYVHTEVTSEEQVIEGLVEKNIQSLGGVLHRIDGGSTLYHPEDISFSSDYSKVSNIFTPFKEKVEKICKIRNLLPLISPYKLSLTSKNDEANKSNYNSIPTLTDLGFTNEEIAIYESQEDIRSKGVMIFHGGEDEGLKRLKTWMFDNDNLKDYFDIRNGMLGEAYSSKLSPWLALGCISPRY